MAFVNTKPTRSRAKRAIDPYSGVWANPVRQFGDLGELGEAGGTGIAFLDDNITAIRTQVDAAALAAKITAYCSIAAGLASVLLLFRTAGR